MKRYIFGKLRLYQASRKTQGICAWFDNNSNFGDQLTPGVLEWLGFQCVHNPSPSAHVLGVGSILGRIPKEFEGAILGSGFLEDGPKVSIPGARIVAVRGELTRDRLGCSKNTVLGDFGILVARIYPEYCSFSGKKHVVGIVPHYCDFGDLRIKNIVEKNNGRVVVINVRGAPQDVIKSISKCQCILSSSLHGLIVADAMRIPNAWVKFSDKLVGGSFKFNDYYSAFGIKRNPKYLNGGESVEELGKLTEDIPPDAFSKKELELEKVLLGFREFVARNI